MHEGRRRSNQHRPFQENAENKRKRGHELQFPEDLQTSLFSQLCLAALHESKIKMKETKMSIIALL